VVIAAPFWDMSFPALLKIYIEDVSVEGVTFRSTGKGFEGLCTAERCVFHTTRGACYVPGDPMAQAVPYLRAIQKFLGFKELSCVAADGLDLDGADVDALVADAGTRAAALAQPP
jgi:FMN-dependent NADH-azoreductase